MVGRDADAASIAEDPLEWRPQLANFSGRAGSIRNAIVEPFWSGRHVLAHFDATAEQHGGEPWLQLLDVEGEDATGEEPDVFEALRGAVLAVDCVIDGFLTDEVSRSGRGASVTLRAQGAPLQPFLPGRPELDVKPAAEASSGAVAFVAVDLLRLDGEPLFEVPLLERKRLLEGVLVQGDLVRVSPYAQPPLEPWLASWKSAGFAGAVVKGANSRYRPHTVSDEWAVVTRIGR